MKIINNINDLTHYNYQYSCEDKILIDKSSKFYILYNERTFKRSYLFIKKYFNNVRLL